jgi:hypothetical protein
MKLTCSVLMLTTACCALSILLPNALAQGATPSLGTWKLNLAKSKSEPGPLPGSLIRINEDRGDGVIVTELRGIDASGKKTFFQFVWRTDGKEYPYGSGAESTISVKATDSQTLEVVIKSEGKATSTATEVYSKDGKTFTRKQESTNGNKLTYVYDRQ